MRADLAVWFKGRRGLAEACKRVECVRHFARQNEVEDLGEFGRALRVACERLDVFVALSGEVGGASPGRRGEAGDDLDRNEWLRGGPGLRDRPGSHRGGGTRPPNY